MRTLSLALLVLVACRAQKVKAVIEHHRPGVDATLAALKALDVASVPKLDATTLSPGVATSETTGEFRSSARAVEPEDAERVLSKCSGAKHAVVIRDRLKIDPVVNDKAKTFTPGIFKGEALLFDLKDKRYVGGYVFSGENEKDEMVRPNESSYDIGVKIADRAKRSFEEETAKLIR